MIVTYVDGNGNQVWVLDCRRLYVAEVKGGCRLEIQTSSGGNRDSLFYSVKPVFLNKRIKSAAAGRELLDLTGLAGLKAET